MDGNGKASIGKCNVLSRRLGLRSMSAACCRSLTCATMTESMPHVHSLCASHQQECPGGPSEHIPQTAHPEP